MYKYARSTGPRLLGVQLHTSTNLLTHLARRQSSKVLSARPHSYMRAEIGNVETREDFELRLSKWPRYVTFTRELYLPFHLSRHSL